MANHEFRSDVSMQDTDAPKLVLFHLVPVTLTVPTRLPVPASFLEQGPYRGSHLANIHNLTTALKIKFDQNASLDEPVRLLSIGSDPKKCALVLDKRHVNPVHCQIFAQLNSGFDVWIVQDSSSLGTR